MIRSSTVAFVAALCVSPALPARAQATSWEFIGVEISGQLWSQPIPIDLLVWTEIDLETGQVEVADLAPRAI